MTSYAVFEPAALRGHSAKRTMGARSYAEDPSLLELGDIVLKDKERIIQLFWSPESLIFSFDRLCFGIGANKYVMN